MIRIWKPKAREWVGRTVRSRRQLENVFFSFPIGALFTVRYASSRGLTLQAPGCTHCGLSGFISTVEPFDVELLPLDDTQRARQAVKDTVPHD